MGDEPEEAPNLDDLPVWISIRPNPEDLTGEMALFWQESHAEIGYICGEWAGLENILSYLFASILRIDVAPAKVILYTVTSIKTKRDIILNAARVLMYSGARLKDIDRIMKRIGKAAAKRNFLVHGEGTINTKHLGRLSVVGTSADLDPALNHYEAWSLHAMREFRHQIADISVSISDLVPKIRRARRAPSRETRPTSSDEAWVAGNIRRPTQPSTPQPQPPPSRESRPKKLSSAQKRALRQKEEAS